MATALALDTAIDVENRRRTAFRAIHALAEACHEAGSPADALEVDRHIGDIAGVPTVSDAILVTAQVIGH